MTKKEFEKYLKSIGGLENGIFSDREPIMTRWFCSVDDGWLEIIHDCIAELLIAGWNKQTTQIKEKRGGLNFNINSGSDEIYKIINKYEKLSYETCEICGGHGKFRNDCGWKGSKWYKTMCEKHYLELKEKRKDG